MLTSTYDVLRRKKLLSTDAQVNALINELASNVVSDADEIQDYALINDEMREAICGPAMPDPQNNWPGYDDEVIWELNDMMGELTRPEGAVYQALTNGYDHLTLGTARVKRLTTTASGVGVVVTKNGRFLTDDPRVTMDYRATPALRAAERSFSRAMARIERDERKIPALTQYSQAAIQASYSRMAPKTTPPKQIKGGK